MRQLFIASIAVVALLASALQSSARSANPSTQSIPVELAASSSVPATLQQQVAGLWSQVALLQSRAALLQSRVATLQSQVATLQSQNASLQSHNSSLQSQNASLQSQVSHLSSQVDSLTGQVNGLRTAASHPGFTSGTMSWASFRMHFNDGSIDDFLIPFYCPVNSRCNRT